MKDTMKSQFTDRELVSDILINFLSWFTEAELEFAQPPQLEPGPPERLKKLRSKEKKNKALKPTKFEQ